MWFESLIVKALNGMVRAPKRRQPKGLLLGQSVGHAPEPLTWPDGKRTQHLFTLGATGQGKTHLMLSLANQVMAAGESLVFFDYHGDAIEELLALASQHPGAAERTVLIDPTDRATSPGLNPLEAFDGDEHAVFSRASELASILRARWQVDAFGARTEELLRNTLFALAATGQTLAEASRFLVAQDFRSSLLDSLTQPEVLDYWHARYEPLSDAMKGAFREPLLNKITGFLTEPACRHVLGQQRSTFRFSDALNGGGWVLVNLAKGRLGEHAHTLGNLIFARLQFEILGRANLPHESRPITSLFVDEMQNLAENDLNVLLNEGRKYGVSLITGHQHLLQVSPSLRGSLLAAGSRVFFRASSSDAAHLAPELSVANRQQYHQELTALPRGHALSRIGADDPVHIAVPKLPPIRRGAEAIAALRLSSLTRYARLRDDIETEIRSRGMARPAVAPHALELPHEHHDEGQQSW